MNFPHPLLVWSNLNVEQFFRSAYVCLFQVRHRQLATNADVSCPGHSTRRSHHCSLDVGSTVVQIPKLPEAMLQALNYVWCDIMFIMPGMGVNHREYMTTTDVKVMKYLLSRPVRPEASAAPSLPQYWGRPCAEFHAPLWPAEKTGRSDVGS
jgi:hypothetical protein